MRRTTLGVIWSIVASLFAVAGAVADNPIVPIKRLSLELALQLAKGAIDACREEGVQVAVTVVDRGGHAQVVLRDVLAMDLTLEVSRRKAYTAMSFGSPTSEISAAAPAALGGMPNVAFLAGGLTIRAGGTIVGGVGVSGAPSGETDERCALAGLEAISDELEFAEE